MKISNPQSFASQFILSQAPAPQPTTGSNITSIEGSNSLAANLLGFLAAAGNSATQFTKRSIVFLVWDIIIPQLTWLLMFGMFYTPATYRPMFFLLYIFPVFSQRLLPKVVRDWMGSVLKTIAKLKGIQVESLAATRDTRPTIYGFYPHNKYPMDVLPAITSSDVFSNTYLAQSSLGKFVPTVGYMTMLIGRVVDVKRQAMAKLLESGKSVGIFPGGHREMIHLQPFAKKIPIVKHIGFLRLAKSMPGTTVTPTYIFNFKDSHISPCQQLDEIMYKKTAFSLPIYLPSLAMRNRPMKVVLGEPIDPSKYSTDEELGDAYFAALEKLFEENKLRVGGAAYADCTLDFVETKKSSNPSKRAPKKKSNLAAGGALLGGFVLAFLAFYIQTGLFWKFSTWEPFHVVKDSGVSALHVHLLSSFVWASITWLHSAKSPRKLTGYISTLSFFAAATSANCLLLESMVHNPTSGHHIFHSFCNLLVTNILVYFTVQGLLAVIVYKNKGKHMKMMKAMFMTMVVSFMPRVYAFLVRWVFKGILDGTESFTVACLVHMAFIVTTVSALGKKPSKFNSTLFRGNMVSSLITIIETLAMMVGLKALQGRTVELAVVLVLGMSIVASFDATDDRPGKVGITKPSSCPQPTQKAISGSKEEACSTTQAAAPGANLPKLEGSKIKSKVSKAA